MDGPYSETIQLLIHLWVIRVGLADKQSLAHPVPDVTFASETLHDLIHDPGQQALIEKFLPSLVEEEGISDQIKYFVPSWRCGLPRCKTILGPCVMMDYCSQD